MKTAQTSALVEGDAPAVTVRAGLAAAQHQTLETETDIGRDVGAHAQQFTHG